MVEGSWIGIGRGEKNEDEEDGNGEKRECEEEKWRSIGSLDLSRH